MEDLAFTNQLEQRNQQPSLSIWCGAQSNYFKQHRRLFSVVDAGLMRKAAQETTEKGPQQTLNWTARSVSHEAMVGKIDDIVCGDLAMGGLSLNGSFSQRYGIALLGFNSAGSLDHVGNRPSWHKSYGPAKSPETKTKGDSGREQPDRQRSTEISAGHGGSVVASAADLEQTAAGGYWTASCF